MLFRISEGKAYRYRCHTGHGFSQAALLDALSESVETTLWKVVKRLQEASTLMSEGAAQLREGGDSERAQRVNSTIHEIDERLDTLRSMALEHGALREDAFE